MATFDKLSEFSHYNLYVLRLKLALQKVKLNERMKFLYFKEYPFADKKMQCVLLDFSPQCLNELTTIARRRPTAEGKVTLTADGKLLKFDSEKGTFKAVWLKNYFAKIPGIKDVFVDQNEAEDDSHVENDAARAPALAPVVPPLPPLPHGRPNAPQPIAGTPAGVRPPTSAPAQPPERRVQPNAPPPNATGPAQARPTAAAKAPIRVAMPLPANQNDQKTIVADYLKALSTARLPINEDVQKAVLKRAGEYSMAGDYAQALHYLNSLVRDVAYPDIDEWALREDTRKYERELLTEKYVGLLNLINAKRKKPTDWMTEQTEIGRLINQIVDFNEEMKKCLLAANPTNAKRTFDKWAGLVKRHKELAEQLKKLWIKDQTDRLKKESATNKLSYNTLVAKAYGLESTLGLAQMAEIQAIQYQKNAKQGDPLADGDWHKKLEVAELAAIYGYSTADYTAIAQILRNEPPKSDEQRKTLEANKRKFDAYIKAGTEGLNKLPAYTGKGKRCTMSLWPDTIKNLTASGVHVEKSFMSVGKTKVPGFGDIVWHIEKITTGKDVTMFSLHQSEGEILFPPGSEFRFTNGSVKIAGQVVQITSHDQIAKYVTPDTKAGDFYFEQIS